MKLYDLRTEPCRFLEKHPEFINQRPKLIGILGRSVQRFIGTNVYSWYVNYSAGFWKPYGEPIMLTPYQIKKFKNQS